jgi:hypothetical protein
MIGDSDNEKVANCICRVWCAYGPLARSGCRLLIRPLRTACVELDRLLNWRQRRLDRLERQHHP